jgi:hypothetical protein
MGHAFLSGERERESVDEPSLAEATLLKHSSVGSRYKREELTGEGPVKGDTSRA